MAAKWRANLRHSSKTWWNNARLRSEMPIKCRVKKLRIHKIYAGLAGGRAAFIPMYVYAYISECVSLMSWAWNICHFFMLLKEIYRKIGVDRILVNFFWTKWVQIAIIIEKISIKYCRIVSVVQITLQKLIISNNFEILDFFSALSFWSFSP